MEIVEKDDKEYVKVEDEELVPGEFMKNVDYYVNQIREQGYVLISRTIFELEMDERGEELEEVE